MERSWRQREYAAQNVCCVAYNFKEKENKTVEEIGFGSLIHLKMCLIDIKLVLWFVDQFNSFRHTIESHWTVYPIASKAVEKLMGLPDDKSACDDTNDVEALKEMKEIKIG